MRNAGKALFLGICMAIIMLPFAGMFFGIENVTSENRKLAAFPHWEEHGRWNPYFLQELGSYFEDHFAFRSFLVSADAILQSKVFGVSNTDAVTVGTDGWLYYTASMGDYLGKNQMSERCIQNAAHNLSLVQRYVEENGASFLFAVAPNKNSLYGDHLPYYIRKNGTFPSNYDRLKQKLEENKTPYVDLLGMFQMQEETLYLKRDSHWNNKGAMMAYRAMMEALGLEYETYETRKAVRQKTAYGDLNRMLYPVGGEPEWDYCYQGNDRFTYRTDTESVEDAWIATECSEGEKTVLMSRDSFGNTLLPFFANQFSEGYFSRGVPFQLAGYMETCQPDVVILEKVERELPGLAKTPPLMEGIPISLKEEEKKLFAAARMRKESGVTMEAKVSEYDMDYLEISGLLGEGGSLGSAQVYLRITDGSGQKVYEPFLVATEESDYGYCLYLKKDEVQSSKIGVEIIRKDGGTVWCVQSFDVSIKEVGRIETGGIRQADRESGNAPCPRMPYRMQG